MQQDKIYNDISTLPPEAQRQVADFVAFLRARYKTSQTPKIAKRDSILNEPFIGMWKDREDMKDSRKWLRNVRKSEWGETS